MRKFAVQCLDQLDDQQLSLYIPQLVQACKFEMYHYSPLSEFLISRGASLKIFDCTCKQEIQSVKTSTYAGLKSRLVIGQRLFWELKVAIAQERVDKGVEDLDEDNSLSSSNSSKLFK